MTEISPSSSAEAAPIGELRDTERLIALWRQHASKSGGPPPVTAFDFSRMIGGDWSYRFVICADTEGDDHTFLMYGAQFARLLGLPETPAFGASFNRQLPERYLPLFTEGCGEAIALGEPARMNGFVLHYGQIELYRSVFAPLAMRPNSPAGLILGSFNRRIGPRAHEADAVRKIYNLLSEPLFTNESFRLE
jgi:hypothetical protein